MITGAKSGILKTTEQVQRLGLHTQVYSVRQAEHGQCSFSFPWIFYPLLVGNRSLRETHALAGGAWLKLLIDDKNSS
jgi:hypothetical protein